MENPSITAYSAAIFVQTIGKARIEMKQNKRAGYTVIIPETVEVQRQYHGMLDVLFTDMQGDRVKAILYPRHLDAMAEALDEAVEVPLEWME